MTASRPVNATQIAQFLQQHLPDCRDEALPDVVARVSWHMRLSQALVVVDAAGEIAGAALGRIIATLADGPKNYVNDPAGQIVWVDLIATRAREALPRLIAELAVRWGDKERVAGTVFSRNGELRVFPMKRLLKFTGD